MLYSMRNDCDPTKKLWLKMMSFDDVSNESDVFAGKEGE